MAREGVSLLQLRDPTDDRFTAEDEDEEMEDDDDNDEYAGLDDQAEEDIGNLANFFADLST